MTIHTQKAKVTVLHTNLTMTNEWAMSNCNSYIYNQKKIQNPWLNFMQIRQ